MPKNPINEWLLSSTSRLQKTPTSSILAFTIKSLILLLTFTSCAAKTNIKQPNGFIRIKGSDTIVNAAQRLAEEFMKKYPYIFVAVTGGGSGVGIASLINKTCDIADASRKMDSKEIKIANQRGVFPEEFVIAYDGIALIVNNNNPINKITIKDLHNIFTGKITNWKGIGGIDKGIITLSRDVSSGTYMYFKNKVIHLGKNDSKEEFYPQTLLLSSNQEIVEEVANDEGAIGYVGMGYISSRTKALKVAKNNIFYPPTIQSVALNKYPISRPLQMYTNGKPKGIVKLFIDFVYSSPGQKVIEETGFVPLKLDGAKPD